MKEGPKNDVYDGYIWWCRQCKGRKTIREGILNQINFVKVAISICVVGQ